MTDLYWALLLMTVLAALTFAGVLWIGREFSSRTINLLSLSVVALMTAYIATVWDQFWLVRLLPFSSLPVLGNWFPLWAAILAALVTLRTDTGLVRRVLSSSALFTAAGLSLIAPLVGTPPECGAAWLPEGICLQTTPSTCSAACAATLLTQHGIQASEREMAELCLTRRGTTWQGLYHGLKRKTADSPWDVQVDRFNLEQLQQLAGEPVILRVGLPRGAHAALELHQEMGWRPGAGHSVILLGFLPHGQVAIADPTPGIGRETWSIDDLRTLWDGQVVRLVPKAGQAVGGRPNQLPPAGLQQIANLRQ
jgi:hypothetical protein